MRFLTILFAYFNYLLYLCSRIYAEAVIRRMVVGSLHIDGVY